jgi:hypothetical protein
MTDEEFARAVFSPNTVDVEARAQAVKQKLIDMRHASEQEFQETVWQVIGAVREHRAIMRNFDADFLAKYGVAPEDEIARRPACDPHRKQWEQQKDFFAVLEAVAETIGVPAELLEPRAASAPLSQ